MGGTGLGLAIAKEIVVSLHGEIKIESERGIGTSFIIHLPKSDNLVQFLIFLLYTKGKPSWRCIYGK